MQASQFNTMNEVKDWQAWLAAPTPAVNSETPEGAKVLVVDQGLQYEHAAINGFVGYADRPDPQPVGLETGLNDLTGESLWEYGCYMAYTPVGTIMLTDDVTEEELCPPTMNHRSPVIDYIPPEK